MLGCKEQGTIIGISFRPDSNSFRSMAVCDYCRRSNRAQGGADAANPDDGCLTIWGNTLLRRLGDIQRIKSVVGKSLRGRCRQLIWTRNVIEGVRKLLHFVETATKSSKC